MGPNSVSAGQTHKQHVFAEVPAAEIQRSSFDRSHGVKTTFNAMQLVPFYVDEALPGDTFNLSATLLARLATPVKPIMDNLYLDTFFFAIPYRLVWTHWVNFNGEQTNPGDSIAYTIPQCLSPAAGYAVGSLQDYLGLPTAGTPGPTVAVSHSNLWCRAYSLVWNQWFRDENLQNSVTVDMGDGPDLYTNYNLLNRGKRHDYFTSCLPWTQKGAAVTLPLGTSAPVTYVPYTSSSNPMLIRRSTTDALYTPTGYLQGGAGSALADSGAPTNLLYLDPNGRLQANLSAATSATINSIRLAFQIQKLLERDARGGTRYIEIIRSHFGVTSPDARLQRAEYLGGGSQPINVVPVAQSANTPTTGTPQGNLAGYGVGVARGHGFTKSFTEHCLLLGLVNVRADLTYQQGMNVMFSRLTRYDFYWPALSHIGEQAVLNKEIYCDGTANDSLVFGYQERYAEYRYKPSIVTGQFRSTYSTPLDVWHLADKYAALPTLGAAWISAAPPMARIEAVAGGPDFLCDIHISLRCARPMPVYGVPGLIDHF